MQMFCTLAQDSSKWVKMAAFQHFGAFLHEFGGENSDVAV